LSVFVNLNWLEVASSNKRERARYIPPEKRARSGAKQARMRKEGIIILLPSMWILFYCLLWYVFDQGGIGDRWWLICWISLAITLPCWTLAKRHLYV
jgi:hypothetical protein